MPQNEVLLKSVRQKHYRLNVGDAEDGDYSSLTELRIPPSLLEVDGDLFLLHDSGAASGDDRFLMFGTRQNKEVLAECEVWMADGTFRVCPLLFTQMYTIHGCQNGFTFPCFFVCLPNKTKRGYLRMWEKVFELLYEPMVEVVILDFEQAAAQALAEVKPDLEIDGCFFHFRQAIQKHVRDKGHLFVC